MCDENEGYFIATKIGGEFLSILVDTGANVSILNKKIFDSWDKSKWSELVEPVNLNLLSATGDTSPFYGKLKILICIHSHMNMKFSGKYPR